MHARRRVFVTALVVAFSPVAANAWVVVRGPVFVAPRPIVVAPVPVVVAPVPVAPVPVVVAPAPVVVAAPAPAPPHAFAAWPINTTMWVLPSGCLKLFVNGQLFYQCGPNWLRQYQSDKGPYYGVVPPP